MSTVQHGCCADQACTDKTCMQLPVGVSCGDCANFRHCEAFYSHSAADTYCDFFPRRFKPALSPPAITLIQIGPLDV